jgi:tRNA U34 5-methylaminomethyl-2-thiouridine-forming methyltransferase MnmC
MMHEFNDAFHTIVNSEDGSCTAFSTQYNEHYHATSDGALNESLNKHVIPAFSTQRHKSVLHILDICFGLGYNTLATLYYLDQAQLDISVQIISPELDADLIASLPSFTYPEAFRPYLPILHTLVREGTYQDAQRSITLYIGDARAYVASADTTFDIVYQDAFSPKVNPALWTQEYFADVVDHLAEDGVITTYSTALKTRLALHHNALQIHLIEGKGFRTGTIASRYVLPEFTTVDMAHKIACNLDVTPLRDADLTHLN